MLSVTNKPKEEFGPEPKRFVEECGLWPPGAKESRRGLRVHVYPKSCPLGKEMQMCGTKDLEIHCWGRRKDSLKGQGGWGEKGWVKLCLAALGDICFSEDYHPVSLHYDLEGRREPLGSESERRCAQQP